jgi:hypothetical protein
MNSFSETQRFRQWWIWLLLLFAVVVIAVKINYRVTIVDGAIVSKHLSWQISRMALVMLVVVLFWLLRLEVTITELGITYRFYPLQIRYRNIQWEEVEKAYVRIYKPIPEFGGWGIKFGRNGRALNVSGNVGLQIEYKTGKRLLIGTIKRDELEAFMKGLYEKGIVKDDEPTANLRDRY